MMEHRNGSDIEIEIPCYQRGDFFYAIFEGETIIENSLTERAKKITELMDEKYGNLSTARLVGIEDPGV